jgi:hypothetical protein
MRLRGVLLVVAILATACSSSGSDGGGSPSGPPDPLISQTLGGGSPTGPPDPVISQHFMDTGNGGTIVFRLSRKATCDVNTDGTFLPFAEPPEDRPPGRNFWPLDGATYGTVTCS